MSHPPPLSALPAPPVPRCISQMPLWLSSFTGLRVSTEDLQAIQSVHHASAQGKG